MKLKLVISLFILAFLAYIMIYSTKEIKATILFVGLIMLLFLLCGVLIITGFKALTEYFK